MRVIDGLSRPFAVNQNSKGQTLVGDFNASEVLVYGENLKKRFSLPEAFLHPHSIAFDQEDNIWVCDYGHKKIFRFAPDGRFLNTPIFAHSSWPELLAGPASAYFDPVGNVIVSDYGSSTIQKFTQKGEFIEKLSGFDRPHCVGFDLDQNMYVVDTWNHRLQVYSPAWTFLYTFPYKFNVPVTIDFCGDQFIVSQNGDSTVHCFSVKEKKHLWVRSEFNHPYDAKLKPGLLLVADSDNRRVCLIDL